MNQFDVHIANELGYGVTDTTANPTLPLFCDDAINLSLCVDRADADEDTSTSATEKTRFVLQEHNRFWLHIMQALKFKGDDHLSNVFMTLYRHQVNPFTQSAAITYKSEQQALALGRFDEILTIVGSAPMVKVLESWPIEAYLQRGNDWLKIIQGVIADRMETIASVVDIDRRIFLERSLQGKYDILQNAVQMEYLFQAYLLWQQIQWQQEAGVAVPYEGKSARIFREGQAILNQVNANRNELGVFDNQVYFEQTRDIEDQRLQWRLYHDLLMGGEGNESGGMFNEAQLAVDTAVIELQASLRDLDSLEEKLFSARREISLYIGEQCGPSGAELDEMLSSTQLTDQNGDGRMDYCDYLLKTYPIPTIIKNVRDCKLNDNSATRNAACTALGISSDDFHFSCDDPVGGFGYGGIACRDISDTFISRSTAAIDNTGTDPLNQPARCDLNQLSTHSVSLGGRQRLCIGGEMGNLIQERRRLELSMMQVVVATESLMKRVADSLGLGQSLSGNCRIDEDSDRCSNPKAALLITKEVLGYIEMVAKQAIAAVDITKKTAISFAEGIKCVLVAGFSVGTNCPQGLASASVKAGATQLDWIKFGISTAFLVANRAVATASNYAAHDYNYGGLKRELYKIVRDVDDLVIQFQGLVQEVFNTNLEIENLKYQIQHNYSIYQDDVRFALDHLIGRETGNLLRGRQLVLASDKKFRKVLQYAYRMLMAFKHDYSLSSAQINNLKYQLISAVTLSDVRNFIEALETYELEYCGREGIDCDTINNTEMLTLSLRERLFPGLRDSIGANNRVITAGEKFHNIITSPPYLKQTVLNGRPIQVIELKITLPLDMQEYGPQGPTWLINPLECNHHLTGFWDVRMARGNIAVNFKGQRLGEGQRSIRYELIRGGVDLMRGCHAESVIEEVGLPPVTRYPIRTYTVGYAPQSNEALLAQPRSFVTRSGNLNGCINAEEERGGVEPDAHCWRFFARGRSLSAMDWTLRIPISIDDANTESSWVMGEGLPSDARPLIEDITVYMRYRARPTAND
jgi:hypothetical protein